MLILAAMTRMRDVLVSADAPARQLDGVRAWRVDVAAATKAARVFPEAAGMRITTTPGPRLTRGWVRPQGARFMFGDPTHRAWRDLCRTIVAALGTQQRHAALIREAAQAEAEHLGTGTAEEQALAHAATFRAVQAEQWLVAAAVAESTGRALIQREDRIMRPVGHAIAAAGGIAEVARDKHYHAGRL